MRHLAILLWILLLSFPAYGEEKSLLEKRINQVLANQCTESATVSMLVKSLGTGKVLYSKAPDLPMVPASTMKIVTSIAALEILKPDYIFKTHFSHTGTRVGDVINGDLIISGGGDPHIVIEDLFLMANELKKRGVNRVTGNLILDESYFELVPFPKGWKPSSKRRAYEAPIGALSFNFNSFAISIFPPIQTGGKAVVSLSPDSPYFSLINNVRVVNRGRSKITLDFKKRQGGGETVVVGGQIHSESKDLIYYRSVKYPLEYFGMTFIHFLSMSGVTFGGGVVHDLPEGESKSLFIYESKPLFDQVAFMNKYSNNFMAEHILKTISAESVAAPGSQSDGVKRVEEFLGNMGFNSDSYRIYDGSGFARENRLTTSLIVHLLEHAYKKWEYGPEFITSLALMGKDGSVEERMVSTNKTIRVKTGTLNSVSALSGFYPVDSGDILAFSILFNNLPCENGEILDVQHRLLRQFDKADGY
ncbi:MAG: D-alanyl-D-alanine carboxypeptidase/D-alanyl-D-alanine-endopeptidase [Nitrospinota bacterium]|nr:D-alanyl-D-alanine carboxypeptidase/D-alanyl-D-alanine-endopeptidase [Nitrospinota bacterium]